MLRPCTFALPALALFLGLTGPASAAGEGILGNTDIVVAISFVLFIGVLLYFKVPGLIGGLLDKRAEQIRAELDQARALREEAQGLLAEYQRQHKDVEEQTARIVAHARAEAQTAIETARSELKQSIERRLRAAADQIASAEAAALRNLRDQAVQVATKAATEVIAARMSQADAAALIDTAITDTGKRLH